MREAIDNLLKDMEIPTNFGGDEYGDFYGGSIGWMADQIWDIMGREDVEFETGASKLVILIEELDEVIKIPFNGTFYYDEDESLDITDTEDFIENDWANDINAPSATDWDYCENEVLKLEKAEKEGFGDFFAKIEKYTMIDNHPVYLQEKVIPLYSHKSKQWGEPSKMAKSIYENNFTEARKRVPIPEDWLMHAIDYFGEEEVASFIDYVMSENLDEDLHSGNVGFTRAGKPVLLDWAGWRN